MNINEVSFFIMRYFVDRGLKLHLTFGGMLRLRTPTAGEGLAWFLHSRRTLFFFLITKLSRRQLQNIENVKLVSIL